MQVVKCDDYFQEEDGPRKFGNISVTTKLMVKTESSLVLRLLEVTKTEVKSLNVPETCGLVLTTLPFQLTRRN